MNETPEAYAEFLLDLQEKQRDRIAALEAERADTKRQLELTEGSYNSDMRNAIAEHEKLEAEVLALREFVAAARELVALLPVTEDSTVAEVTTYVLASERYAKANRVLATDHGLPLPGAGEGA